MIDVAGAPARGPDNVRSRSSSFPITSARSACGISSRRCRRFEADYIKTGKIRYVFRDFPIDRITRTRFEAHEAAHCAIEQNGQVLGTAPPAVRAPGTHTTERSSSGPPRQASTLAAYPARASTSGRATAAIRRSADVASAARRRRARRRFSSASRDKATDQVRILATSKARVPYDNFAAEPSSQRVLGHQSEMRRPDVGRPLGPAPRGVSSCLPLRPSLPRIHERLRNQHRLGGRERFVDRRQAVRPRADQIPRHFVAVALEGASARRKCPASLPQQPRMSRCLRLMCSCALIVLSPTFV